MDTSNSRITQRQKRQNSKNQKTYKRDEQQNITYDLNQAERQAMI